MSVFRMDFSLLSYFNNYAYMFVMRVYYIVSNCSRVDFWSLIKFYTIFLLYVIHCIL